MILSNIVVLLRDDDYIVVDKPVGLPTTSPDDGDCLVARVRELDPDAPQLHPLSRLDAQVSGIVCFARTARANERALSARAEGTFKRRYIGLTLARVAIDAGQWEFAIAFDPRDPRKRTAVRPGARVPSGAKQAQTRFAVRARTDALTALDLYPLTGRTHQLRVHACAAGMPLFGDVLYGAPKRAVLVNGRVLTAQRVMLHCAHVHLPRGRGEVLTLDLHPPADFCRVFASGGGDPALLSEALPRT